MIINDNIPYFTENELLYTSGQAFSELDQLGRCGPAIACLERSMMPAEERGEIGQVKPSGWHTVKYPGIIADRYLYNRSHLIAYAMTGINDDPRNLITGTRYMNSVTMLEFEIKVLEYLDVNDGHVLYRVTPYFRDNELVARGVEMEAISVEDRGRSLMFHVFVYNYQPGIEIDYSDGSSRAVISG
ncbi:MAG: DNA/RNA non-specific endonuclease [Lachnospiraceae bacterium]|nr:DNA/RNA non-specific endonuclease [Lachnospiraceae bacterium]